MKNYHNHKPLEHKVHQVYGGHTHDSLLCITIKKSIIQFNLILKSMFMKNLMKISGMAVALLVLFTACKREETNEPIVEGIYEGTLTGSQVKSTLEIDESKPASAEITITGENKIQIHCYAEGFDTTFMMNYYHHNDSAYVCYTGDDFEEMYGHMLGEGHMGGMMEDMHDGETQWMHHMNEEHENGEEHFGGFNMANHSFSYTFQMNKNDSSDDIHFQGIKQ